MARIFIGVAWPYANGPFHLGHLAGAYLPADEFARFHRLRGNEVLMVSGSDMHGTPVAYAAEREGTDPAVVAQRNHELNRDAFAKLGISFDLYTDTHTALHAHEVQALFLQLLRRGFVDRGTEEEAYCPKEQRFLPDRYLVGTCPHCGFDQARGDECDRCGRLIVPRELGHPRCQICGTPAEFRPTEQFYFRLDKLDSQLAKFLAQATHWRPRVVRFAENFRKGGLRPTPITRDLSWGIPLPLDGYDTKRFYVWFDAVIGYLSASKDWAARRGTPDAWKPFWEAGRGTRAYYFVGKDNTFHHALFWPGMLLGAGGFELPYDVPANEWLVSAGRKLAKSSGSVTPADVPSLLRQGYAPEAIRFYAAALAPEHHDTEYKVEELDQIGVALIAHQWGNLVQRTLVLARDRFENRIPAPPAGWTGGSSALGQRIRDAHARITEAFEQVRLRDALDLVMTEVREQNRWIQEARPWDAQERELRTTIYEGLWFLRAAGSWLAPVLPQSAEKLFRMLGFAGGPGPGDWEDALHPPPEGQTLGRIEPLYTSRLGSMGEASSSSSPDTGAPQGAPPELELRAALITGVAEVAGTDRLYRVTLDVGGLGTRTVVAGLRPFLSRESLLGRRIVLLANLEPRKIRSVTSEGMILAAESDGIVRPLTPPEGIEPGARVGSDESPAARLAHAEFEKLLLRVGRVVASDAGEARISVGDQEVRLLGPWPTGAKLVLQLQDAPGSSARVLEFGPGRPISVEDPIAAGAKVR